MEHSHLFKAGVDWSTILSQLDEVDPIEDDITRTHTSNANRVHIYSGSMYSSNPSIFTTTPQHENVNLYKCPISRCGKLIKKQAFGWHMRQRHPHTLVNRPRVPMPAVVVHSAPATPMHSSSQPGTSRDGMPCSSSSSSSSTMKRPTKSNRLNNKLAENSPLLGSRNSKKARIELSDISESPEDQPCSSNSVQPCSSNSVQPCSSNSVEPCSSSASSALPVLRTKTPIVRNGRRREKISPSERPPRPPQMSSVQFNNATSGMSSTIKDRVETTSHESLPGPSSSNFDGNSLYSNSTIVPNCEEVLVAEESSSGCPISNDYGIAFYGTTQPSESTIQERVEIPSISMPMWHEKEIKVELHEEVLLPRAQAPILIKNKKIAEDYNENQLTNGTSVPKKMVTRFNRTVGTPGDCKFATSLPFMEETNETPDAVTPPMLIPEPPQQLQIVKMPRTVASRKAYPSQQRASAVSIVDQPSTSQMVYPTLTVQIPPSGGFMARVPPQHPTREEMQTPMMEFLNHHYQMRPTNSAGMWNQPHIAPPPIPQHLLQPQQLLQHMQPQPQMFALHPDLPTLAQGPHAHLGGYFNGMAHPLAQDPFQMPLQQFHAVPLHQPINPVVPPPQGFRPAPLHGPGPSLSISHTSDPPDTTNKENALLRVFSGNEFLLRRASADGVPANTNAMSFLEFDPTPENLIQNGLTPNPSTTNIARIGRLLDDDEVTNPHFYNGRSTPIGQRDATVANDLQNTSNSSIQNALLLNVNEIPVGLQLEVSSPRRSLGSQPSPLQSLFGSPTMRFTETRTTNSQPLTTAANHLDTTMRNGPANIANSRRISNFSIDQLVSPAPERLGNGQEQAIAVDNGLSRQQMNKEHNVMDLSSGILDMLPVDDSNNVDATRYDVRVEETQIDLEASTSSGGASIESSSDIPIISIVPLLDDTPSTGSNTVLMENIITTEFDTQFDSPGSDEEIIVDVSPESRQIPFHGAPLDFTYAEGDFHKSGCSMETSIVLREILVPVTLNARMKASVESSITLEVEFTKPSECNEEDLLLPSTSRKGVKPPLDEPFSNGMTSYATGTSIPVLRNGKRKSKAIPEKDLEEIVQQCKRRKLAASADAHRISKDEEIISVNLVNGDVFNEDDDVEQETEGTDTRFISEHNSAKVLEDSMGGVNLRAQKMDEFFERETVASEGSRSPSLRIEKYGPDDEHIIEILPPINESFPKSWGVEYTFSFIDEEPEVIVESTFEISNAVHAATGKGKRNHFGENRKPRGPRTVNTDHPPISVIGSGKLDKTFSSSNEPFRGRCEITERGVDPHRTEEERVLCRMNLSVLRLEVERSADSISSVIRANLPKEYETASGLDGEWQKILISLPQIIHPHRLSELSYWRNCKNRLNRAIELKELCNGGGLLERKMNGDRLLGSRQNLLAIASNGEESKNNPNDVANPTVEVTERDILRDIFNSKERAPPNENPESSGEPHL